MKHARFIAWALSQCWALQPERMAAYAAVLAGTAGGYASGGLVGPSDAGLIGESGSETVIRTTAAHSAGPQRGKTNARSGAIAVIPVHGPIVQRASQIDICEGGVSTQQISAALADAIADDTVAQILLDIDSPGGNVYGVSELADEIRASKKPVVAIANSLAASAAYWLGSAAGEFHMTPGGEVGSIGVWSAHQDFSKYLEAEGVSTTLISAGKFKTEGNPFGPLSQDALGFIQSRIDDYYASFTKAVAKGRKAPIDSVRNGMGQGRVLGADQALSENMVDGVGTFDAVIARMQQNIRTAQPRASRLAAAQREIAIMG